MKTAQLNSRIWIFVLLTGLSVSIGWGIRGQFGHEYGAALAGALGGMVVALLSGREDWRRRVHYFAVFGAIGFAFGGSMSYMKDIWYAHSSDPSTVLYGFACIFLLGFIWAAPAGAGMALPVYLDREELIKFFVPLCTVFGAWYLQSVCCGLVWSHGGGRWFQFFAGYGVSAILAAMTSIAFFLFRRKYWGVGTLLILYMAVGWWAGQFLLITLLHLRMNPPRAETWSSCLGMVFGILACCWQRRLGGIAFATLGVGFLGGIGFSLGTAVKLLVMSSGLTTNWHSIMEQTQGLFLGIAIAIIFATLLQRAPRINDDPPVRRWTELFSVVFVLWLLPYLNFRLSPGEWVGEIKGLQPKLYGINIVSNLLPSQGFVGWMDFVALAMGIALVALLVVHLSRPIPCIPISWIGKGQLFYLVFLWSIVTMNFMLVLPRFTPIRLVTEWFITLNATVCSVLLIYGCFARRSPVLVNVPNGSYGSSIRKVVIFGLVGAVVVTFLGFGIKLACWGNKPAGVLGVDPIRFGPRNTDTIR